MTSRFLTITTTAALVAALSACVTSAPSSRIAAAQATGSQQHGAIGAAPDCRHADDGFNVPDAMKLSKDAFSSCLPQ
jgi:hypothetical protein